MKNIVIFDLDGTIALIDHRRHLVEGEKKDWRAFFAACVDDAPNWPVIEVLAALSMAGNEIWIVSGRSDEVIHETLTWFDKHGVGYHKILMRAAGDFTPDHALKLSWLNSGMIPRDRVLMVFDDRDAVVAMWREQGLTCLQVAPGAF